MEKETTVKEVLIDVSDVLNKINIPISLVESIGIPVARAINGIKICIDAMDRQEQAEKEADEPRLELVKAE